MKENKKEFNCSVAVNNLNLIQENLLNTYNTRHLIWHSEQDRISPFSHTASIIVESKTLKNQLQFIQILWVRMTDVKGAQELRGGDRDRI